VFGITMVLLYTISTFYHGVRDPELKRKLKTLDHISIFLFIAGTYTPLMLVSLSQGHGLLLLGAVWGLAVLGIASELFFAGQVVILCLVIHLLGYGLGLFIRS